MAGCTSRVVRSWWGVRPKDRELFLWVFCASGFLLVNVRRWPIIISSQHRTCPQPDARLPIPTPHARYIKNSSGRRGNGAGFGRQRRCKRNQFDAGRRLGRVIEDQQSGAITILSFTEPGVLHGLRSGHPSIPTETLSSVGSLICGGLVSMSRFDGSLAFFSLVCVLDLMTCKLPLFSLTSLCFFVVHAVFFSPPGSTVLF